MFGWSQTRNRLVDSRRTLTGAARLGAVFQYISILSARNTLGNTGRYGSHNLWEGKPNGPSWHSDRLMLDTFFRGGLRIFDISDPFSIRDVAHYIPAYNPATDAIGSIQINDVYVDDRGYVYIIDRFGDGLFVLSSPRVNCETGRCHHDTDRGDDATN